MKISFFLLSQSSATLFLSLNFYDSGYFLLSVVCQDTAKVLVAAIANCLNVYWYLKAQHTLSSAAGLRSGVFLKGNGWNLELAIHSLLQPVQMSNVK